MYLWAKHKKKLPAQILGQFSSSNSSMLAVVAILVVVFGIVEVVRAIVAAVVG